MLLPNFHTNAILNELRRSMGADTLGDLKLVASGKRLTVAELEVLITGGIDIQSLDDVRVLSDGTLAYKDRRVLLYIRDIAAYGSRRAGADSMPRFHMANCKTLQEMRSKKRIGKYVVAANQSGYFQINRVGGGSGVKTTMEKLVVCQNCLVSLSFRGFSQDWLSTRKSAFVQAFQMQEFFAQYSIDLIDADGAGKEESAPLNDYTGDFGEHARAAKERANWSCESCRRTLREAHLRRFLHAHHRSAVKYDNSPENIEALCIACHANQPNHAHMFALPQYREYTNIFSR